MSPSTCNSFRYVVSLVLGIIVTSFALCVQAQPHKDLLSNQTQIEQGKRIYLEGILPSGEPMQSVVAGDVLVSGTAFTCVSCHMNSGLGSIEGGVFTTPTNGRTLYQKRDMPGSGNNRRNAGMNMASKQKGVTPVQPPSARPAYTDQTLADVLRGGKDPSGRLLHPVMPRYRLEDKDMAALVAYLKTLCFEYSPGVDNYSINFATVITEGVPVEQVEAMMGPLESFVVNANKQQAIHEGQLVKLREIRTEATYRPVKLFRWLLKGKPETWRAQLEEYYRKQPVFALVGGMSSSGWQPVHDFSEDNKIPCILPNVEFPVVSESNWYTLYFSRGYFQEGWAAARFLFPQDQPGRGQKVVQIVRNGSRGAALADGFVQGLKDRDLKNPVTIQLKEGERITDTFLQQLLDKEKPDVLALWTDGDDIRQIAAMKSKNLPKTLLVSSGYLGKELWNVPEQIRDITFITYPYRLPQDEMRYARFIKPAEGQTMTEELRITQSRTYSTLRILTQALREMKGEFFRDYLMDVISMMKDVEMPLYERMSFGPGQRYASKGCYIVQLSKGTSPELIKKSEWVIH